VACYSLFKKIDKKKLSKKRRGFFAKKGRPPLPAGMGELLDSHALRNGGVALKKIPSLNN